MKRRQILTAGLGTAMSAASAVGSLQSVTNAGIVIERGAEGRPHRGKNFALVTPHLDDGPIFAGGTMAKLLKEGYTGHFIRTSNDEKDSYHRTLGETVLANERDTQAFVKALGLKRAFDLSYRNHRIDDVARSEIRGRLIFLFRLLKIDTVLSYDPWGHYEENPDHYVTAQAVEAACWMAGGSLDLPEHFAAGLTPHSVTEKYYFARGPQLVNRVVDTAPTHAEKLAAIRACDTMISHMVKDLTDSLAARKLRLPALSGTDAEAKEAYIKLAFETRDAGVGAKYGLPYGEEFHYIGPDAALEEYISRNAVAL